jgi:hypothetical protein
MVGDMLRHFQFAAVLQIGGDARGAEGVIADTRLDVSRFGAALYHAIGVRLGKRLLCEHGRFSGRRTEEIAIDVAGDAGRGDYSSRN